MRQRTPVEPGCDGSVFCPVEGHVRRTVSNTGSKFTHTKLTRGQLKTLAYRRNLTQALRAQDTTEDQHG